MSLLSSKLYQSACALLLCAGILATPAQGAVLYTTLSAPSVSVGEQFTIDLMVSGLEAGQAVGGFDLDLLFHSGRLTVDEVLFGAALGTVDVDQFTSALLSPGRADLAAVSLLDEAALLGLQSGSFRLAQLVVTAIGPGAVPISFDALAAPGLLLSDQFGVAIAVTGSLGSTVEVRPSADVPEPATALLLLPGLWLAVRRRGAVRA